MRRLGTRLLPAAAAVLLTSACSIPLRSTVAQAVGPVRQAEPFSWEGALAEGAVLEVKGVTGSVRAVPSPDGTARVRATRAGRASDPEEVTVQVLPHGGGVTFCALYPDPRGSRNVCRPGEGGSLGSRDNDVRVDFTVEVPRGVRLFTRTINGDFRADSVAGRIDARTVNGSMRVAAGGAVRLRSVNGALSLLDVARGDASTTHGGILVEVRRPAAGPFRAETVHGTVVFRVPEELGAEVVAESVRGSVVSELPLTVRGALSRSRVRATLGGGGPELRARTTHGDVRLVPLASAEAGSRARR